MTRWAFTDIEEYDELFDSVIFAVWIVIAMIGGAYVMLSVSADAAKTATLGFFYSMVLAGGIFISLIDRSEAVEGRKALWWSVLCFGGLLGIAFISNVFTIGAGLVPKNQLTFLPNYLSLSFLDTLGLGFTTMFGTLYFVATGEEILKALGLFLFNLFKPIEDFFGFTLPETLAAQPLIWIIVLLWSTAHTILGQNPSWYAIPVFFDGIWIVYCQFKGGSWLTGILGHFFNNTFFLGVNSLLMVLV